MLSAVGVLYGSLATTIIGPLRHDFASIDLLPGAADHGRMRAHSRWRITVQLIHHHESQRRGKKTERFFVTYWD
jgi:hypothetical protein